MQRRVITLTLSATLLIGCASAPRLAPLDRNAPVNFVVAATKTDATSTSVRDTTVTRSSGSGAKGGALAGAVYGLTCGPFFIICSPIAALTGAGIGGIAGAAVGESKDLSKDEVAQLNDRLQRLKQAVDAVQVLTSETRDRATKHWPLTDDPAARSVTLAVQRLYLTSEPGKQVALVMQVLASQRAAGVDNASQPMSQKLFSFVAQRSDMATWLDERSDLPETSLRSACQQIAAQVVSELASN